MEEFIKAYQSFPALWNRKHPDHKNREVKQAQYELLLKIYRKKHPHASITGLTRRIYSLRKSYWKDLKLKRQSERNGVLANFSPQGYYYHSLTFLEDAVVYRTSRAKTVEEKKKITHKLANGEYVLSTKQHWRIFNKIEDTNGKEIDGYIQCNQCKVLLVHRVDKCDRPPKHQCYKNLFEKNSDGFEMEENEESQETSKSEISINVDNIGVDFCDNSILKLITKWVVSDCKPFGMTQDDDLLEVCQAVMTLGAKLQTNIDIDEYLPNSTTVARKIGEMYEQRFAIVKAEISTIKENGFGLVAHIWTDSYTKLSYIALTIHYLKYAELKNCLLAFRLLEAENGGAQNIGAIIKIILKDFDCELSHKSIVVTNNDDNILRGLSSINKVPCVTLSISNALQQSIEDVVEIAELTTACIKLNNYLKKSNSPFSLTGDISTSWYSICKMFSFISRNWSKIKQTLQVQNQCRRLDDINVNYLKAVIKTLQPFIEALETLEDYHEPTIHLVFVYLHQLKKECEANKSDHKEFGFIVDLKLNIQTYLHTIFGENITIMHKVALFLYPPTNKLLVFCDEEKKCIEKECIRLCLENESNPITLVDHKTIKTEFIDKMEDVVVVSDFVPTETDRPRDVFSDFVPPETRKGPKELIKQELQCYKQMYVKNSEHFNCLRWWESFKDVFPHLYKLSCSVLATPASIASTQQVFSAAETFLLDILDADCNNTDIEKIMFIKFNEGQDNLY